jgi:hypothetical protein
MPVPTRLIGCKLDPLACHIRTHIPDSTVCNRIHIPGKRRLTKLQGVLSEQIRPRIKLATPDHPEIPKIPTVMLLGMPLGLDVCPTFTITWTWMLGVRYKES